MTRYWNRNLITDRVVRPAVSGANGIYDLSSQQAYKSEDVWPYSGDGLTTDGLAVHLDAGDSSSYSGTGTTWYDLTSNDIDMTIFNGATYSSSDGGYFHFDGSNDYAQYEGSDWTNFGTNPFAVEIWSNFDQAHNGGLAASAQSAGTSWAVQLRNNRKLSFRPPTKTCQTLLSANPWGQYVFVREGTGTNEAVHYINGFPAGTETYATNLSSTAGLRIGRNRANVYFDGKISIVRIYRNRSLSREEVLGNFVSNRDRYSI